MDRSHQKHATAARSWSSHNAVTDTEPGGPPPRSTATTQIMVAVRWYLRYGLSYRDVEELLTERGITVDHVTVYRWVQRYTPLLIDAARPCRHAPGDRWFVDETYVKVAGGGRDLYRAIDQHRQGIDVLVAQQRGTPAAPRFFPPSLSACPAP